MNFNQNSISTAAFNDVENGCHKFVKKKADALHC